MDEIEHCRSPYLKHGVDKIDIQNRTLNRMAKFPPSEEWVKQYVEKLNSNPPITKTRPGTGRAI